MYTRHGISPVPEGTDSVEQSSSGGDENALLQTITCALPTLINAPSPKRNTMYTLHFIVKERSSGRSYCKICTCSAALLFARDGCPRKYNYAALHAFLRAGQHCILQW